MKFLHSLAPLAIAALLSGCAAPDLAGKWQAKWPDGHTSELTVQKFGEGQWYFKGAPPELGGLYQVDDTRLVCTKPDTPQAGFVWRITDSDHLVLIEQPPVEKLGGRWLGLDMDKLVEKDSEEMPDKVPAKVPDKAPDVPYAPEDPPEAPDK